MRRALIALAGLLTLTGLTVAMPSPAGAVSTVFTNATPVTIVDDTTRSSYVNVEGVTGHVTDVNVTITGLSHAQGHDLDLWLVNTGDQRIGVPLMSDRCAGTLSGLTLTFDDEAAAPAPSSGCTSGSYRPANPYWGTDQVPENVVQIGSDLSSFDGTNPVGPWALHVVDDFTGSTGDISGGFSLTVTTTTGAISIPLTASPSSPYPYSFNVAKQPGSLTDVDVVLTGLSHTYPEDLDILLIGPSGDSVMLMSDVCSGADVTGITLRFDDAADASLPTTLPSGSCTSGRFKPTNSGASDTFNAPAPAGPYGAQLSELNGTPANGTWSLYVVDDITADGGYIKAVSVIVKTDAKPNTTILTKPASTTRNRSARFTFTSNKGLVRYQCKIDAKAWQACRSPRTYTGLAVGQHTFRVRAIDNSNQADPTPATYTWRIRR